MSHTDNTKRLNSCFFHQFAPLPKEVCHYKTEWQCIYCKGKVSHQEKEWYEEGLAAQFTNDLEAKAARFTAQVMNMICPGCGDPVKVDNRKDNHRVFTLVEGELYFNCPHCHYRHDVIYHFNIREDDDS